MSSHAIQERLKTIHESILGLFDELKLENKKIEARLDVIEQKLQEQDASTKEREKKKTDKKKKAKEREIIKTEAKTEKKSSTKPVESKIEDSSERKEEIVEETGKVNYKESEEMVDLEEEIIDYEEEIIDDQEEILELDISKLSSKIDDTEDDNVKDNKIIDDGQRHKIETRHLPTKVVEGFCFRPITGWRNSVGNYEISKELITFNPRNVGFNSI